MTDQTPELVPVDGVIYDGSNAYAVSEWLERHSYRWTHRFSDGKDAGFEVSDEAREVVLGRIRVGQLAYVEDGVLTVTTPRAVPWTTDREPAPVHYVATAYSLAPISETWTLCGRPLIDSLTGNPILTVSGADRGAVTCADCVERLAAAEHDRHPTDVVLSRMLEEIAELRRQLKPTPDGFPPSSDMLELSADADGVVAHCLICDQSLGKVGALNEALVVWREHRRAEREKRKP